MRILCFFPGTPCSIPVHSLVSASWVYCVGYPFPASKILLRFLIYFLPVLFPLISLHLKNFFYCCFGRDFGGNVCFTRSLPGLLNLRTMQMFKDGDAILFCMFVCFFLVVTGVGG